MRRTVFLLVSFSVLLGLPVFARADAGILLELDRSDYRVHVRDLATGEIGPTVQVAVGSPAHPTPAGRYRLYTVIRDPDWEPGETARRYGAERIPASPDGPLGVAKIPFFDAYALHGGANRFTVGKPVSLGCVRAMNEALEGLLDWLDGQGALGRVGRNDAGERPQPFTRPARLVIR